MARQPALNEEALVKLGSEKLARLVIGEAKRNDRVTHQGAPVELTTQSAST